MKKKKTQTVMPNRLIQYDQSVSVHLREEPQTKTVTKQNSSPVVIRLHYLLVLHVQERIFNMRYENNDIKKQII